MTREKTPGEGRVPARRGAAARRSGGSSAGAPATGAKSTRAAPRRTSAAAIPASGSGDCGVDSATRERMIAEAAYYMAEGRGFACGNELDDWLAAETAIDEQIEMVKRGEAGKGLF